MKKLTILLLSIMAFCLCSCTEKEEPSVDGEQIYYILTVNVNNSAWGTANGSGTYSAGEQVEIKAIPFDGYHFVKWNDNVSQNPRTITMNEDMTYTAILDKDPDDPEILPDAFDENGASYKLFSVSATKQVRFSKGNLQFQASTGTWRLADHQYDCIISGNRNVSSTYDGWIDLFGWGCSGYVESFPPYLSSNSNMDYPTLVGVLSDEDAEYDWAWHNPIENGSNQPHEWRTLTKQEWGYLIQSRQYYHKLATATIAGQYYGLVLLPDVWQKPTGITFNYGQNGWNTNQYTAEEWAKLEASGAIFLPAAGYRYGTVVNDYDNVGIYWTVTSQYNSGSASFFGFSGTNNSCARERYKCDGCSVRPVKDAD